MERLAESKINLIHNDTLLEGQLRFSGHTRVQGILKGTVDVAQGSEFMLSENGAIEGELSGDIIYISGYFRGKIKATTEIKISGLARVFGELEAPKIKIEPGAHFEGITRMEKFHADRESS